MTKVEDLAPAVSDRLAYQFKRVQIELAGLHEELLAPFDISSGELAILLLIDAREPASQQQIAHRLGIDRTTMVALIDALEIRNWSCVARTRRTGAATSSNSQIQAKKRFAARREPATRPSNDSSPSSTTTKQPNFAPHCDAPKRDRQH